MGDKLKISDWLNSINDNKNDIMTAENESQYIPYVINHALSNFPDALFYVAEVNTTPAMTKRMQYNYLRRSLRPRKRYSPWYKPKNNYTIKIISDYYECSIKKAQEYEKVLSESDINEMENYLDFEGGIK